MIEIPYWWDQRSSSLAATINKVRPDLIQNIPLNSEPISDRMPERMVRAQLTRGTLHNLRNLITIVATKFDSYSFAKSKSWDISLDPVGWWLWEDKRGIRTVS
jgi:hypothetical protein